MRALSGQRERERERGGETKGSASPSPKDDADSTPPSLLLSNSDHSALYSSEMLLKATAAIALLSSAVFAAPAQYDQGAARPQVVLCGARQAALNWGADKLSKLGDNGEMHAMTQWGWTDCGAFALRLVTFVPHGVDPARSGGTRQERRRS